MIVHEEVPGPLAGERLDRVVSMLTDLSRTRVAELIEAGAVSVDGSAVSQRSLRVNVGMQVEVNIPAPGRSAALTPESDVTIETVHIDDHLVVVDKPAGLVVHPGAGQTSGTLVHGLLALYPEIAEVGDPARPGIVHRLDKGTSGLLLVARTQVAYDALVAALAARLVQRRYRALAWGGFEAARGLIDAPIGRSVRQPTRMRVDERGKEARTRYAVLRAFTEPVEVSELKCTLETGRTHQIRVHLGSIGHPVVGDSRYGGERQSFPLGRPFLHAEELELEHPVTGENISFRSELPPDLTSALARLR